MELIIGINRKNPTPIYLQIKNQIQDKILNREMLKGFRLVSERKLAAKLNVHRNTVVKAYHELVADGLVDIQQRPRAYIVSYDANVYSHGEAGGKKQFSSFDYLVKDEFLQFNTMFSKLFFGSLNAREISFAGQIPTRELYPELQIKEIMTELAGADIAEVLDYCSSRGLKPLREAICELLVKSDIHASSSEIQIVAETTQALDYILRLYMYPRDVIVVEEPVFTDTMNLFKLMGLKVVGVPVDKDGMVTCYLEQIIAKYKPKFIYTIPYFHNPTTTVMSLERRAELLEISYRHNIPIIEEDCVSEFRFDRRNIPTLKAMDRHSNVIYLNSFLYTIFPGLRVAYMVAPKEVTSKVSQLMGIEQISIGSLGQHMAFRFVEKGYYGKHLEEVRGYYEKKRDVMCRELAKINDLSFEIPRSGTCVWCRMPDEIDQMQLLKNANALGVSFVPGYLFFPYGNQGDNYIRLSYSHVSDDDIVKGVGLLQEAIALCK